MPVSVNKIIVTPESELREAADQARADGLWEKALSLYQRIPNCLNNSAVLMNMAVCCLGLAMYQRAYNISAQALFLKSDLWQAEVVKINCLKALGKRDEWVSLVAQTIAKYPDLAEIRLEYASVLMTALGDASGVQRVLKPLLTDPVHSEKARLMSLMSMLYDRPSGYTARMLTKDIKEYAKEFLYVSEAQRKSLASLTDVALKKLDQKKYPTKKKGSKRIGFISGLFTASPVYFLTIDKLLDLHAQGYELYFFARTRKNDWATERFRKIASAWVELAGYDAPQIEAVLSACELDELFDLAGWTDVQVLKALSSKPVPIQYKWVGGQSCTTGLYCFDGYITDELQTPSETFELYTEPLVSMGEHYVNYTPPEYMPQPRSDRTPNLSLKMIRDRGFGKLGVVANPLKISTQFLDTFSALLKQLDPQVEVVFLDYRYRLEATRNRIVTQLGSLGNRIQFVSLDGHDRFLAFMNGLDLIVDTFPYSGGLTVCEAIHLNIPIYYYHVERKLFCERHILSHLNDYRK